jgi:hypothetical protein
MNHFAGNMLQVENSNSKKYLVMSTQAFESLTEDQIELITILMKLFIQILKL